MDRLKALASRSGLEFLVACCSLLVARRSIPVVGAVARITPFVACCLLLRRGKVDVKRYRYCCRLGEH